MVVEGLAGGSPGKLIVGLRVLRPDGTPAGVGKALIRFALWIVDGLPYCFPLVALIVGSASTGHRRVGDMAAGTFVVGKAHQGRPVSVPGLTPPAAYAGYAPAPGGYGGYGTTPGGTGGDATGPTQAWTPGTEAPASAAYGPQWDAARNTYIQWDPDRGSWLEWDTARNEWRPI